MIGNPTPQRPRVLVEPGLPITGFPELLESGAMTTTEGHMYQALAFQRLEAARRDLGFTAMLAAEVGSKKPAAA